MFDCPKDSLEFAAYNSWKPSNQEDAFIAEYIIPMLFIPARIPIRYSSN